MDRRVISLLLALSICAIASNAIAQDVEQRRPNIVLIMIDDLAWMDLACQGNLLVDTPNIDRLATQGMRLTDAYAAAPVCSPTRASIVSGQSPARLHLTTHIPDGHQPKGCTLYPPEDTRDRLPLETVTIAERLKEAGYATAFLGKWHLSGRGWGDEEFFPDRQGFDVNIGGCGFGGPSGFFHPYRFPNLKSEVEGEYLPDRLADEAIAWMESKKGQPFMMFLWNYTVHWPVAAKADVFEKYKDRNALVNKEYGAMVECMDQAIGRVITAIDEMGLAEDTLIVFTSDNGGFSGVTSNAPLRESKGYLYEGGIRVPMIVRWPGRVEEGVLCDTPVVTTDLYPTFLQVAGLKPSSEKPLDGESLIPLWTGKGKPSRDMIGFHFPNYAWHKDNRLGSAIRSGDYKLLKWYDDGSTELYNLKDDLSEKNDLTAAMPEKSAELEKKLDAWLKDVDAAMPVRKP